MYLGSRLYTPPSAASRKKFRTTDPRGKSLAAVMAGSVCSENNLHLFERKKEDYMKKKLTRIKPVLRLLSDVCVGKRSPPRPGTTGW